ncbi:MAG TPA: hypothetical protein VHR72_00070 [Gemmataceae bacterium]|nr:hypothetical protein [Gemmataceae bacterium]
MPKALMIEELHLSFFVPSRLVEAEVAAVRRVLTSSRFAGRLLRATKEIARQWPALARVRITLSR